MSCKQGLDDLHRQLYEGRNSQVTRGWLKDVLFPCHYSVEGCGYEDNDLCVCGAELSLHPTEPLHNFVSATKYFEKPHE